MKRILAVCVVLISLSSGAMAQQDSGWYLGLGVGYDHAPNFTENVSSGFSPSIPSDGGFLATGSYGYKWSDPLRLEFEVGYGTHGIAEPYNGTTSTISGMVNGIYTLPISFGGPLNIALGGGLGFGGFKYCTGLGVGCTGGTVDKLGVQGIIEFNSLVAPGIEIYLQGRERAFLGNDSSVRDVQEEAVLVGARFYLGPK